MLSFYLPLFTVLCMADNKALLDLTLVSSDSLKYKYCTVPIGPAHTSQTLHGMYEQTASCALLTACESVEGSWEKSECGAK